MCFRRWSAGSAQSCPLSLCLGRRRTPVATANGASAHTGSDSPHGIRLASLPTTPAHAGKASPDETAASGRPLQTSAASHGATAHSRRLSLRAQAPSRPPRRRCARASAQGVSPLEHPVTVAEPNVVQESDQYYQPAAAHHQLSERTKPRAALVIDSPKKSGEQEVGGVPRQDSQTSEELSKKILPNLSRTLPHLCCLLRGWSPGRSVQGRVVIEIHVGRDLQPS